MCRAGNWRVVGEAGSITPTRTETRFHHSAEEAFGLRRPRAGTLFQHSWSFWNLYIQREAPEDFQVRISIWWELTGKFSNISRRKKLFWEMYMFFSRFSTFFSFFFEEKEKFSHILVLCFQVFVENLQKIRPQSFKGLQNVKCLRYNGPVYRFG